MALTKNDKTFIAETVGGAVQKSEKKIIRYVNKRFDEQDAKFEKRFNQLDNKIDELEKNVLKVAKTDYLTMRDIEKRLKKVEKRVAD